MNNFQTILTAVFLAFFVFAVLIFSGLLKIGDSQKSTGAPAGKIVIWGTFANSEILKVFEDTTGANRDLTINYVRKPESTYQQALIEAFASGTGPDLFLISADMVQKNEGFIYKIPYTNYPEKTYRDSFIDGADVYLTKTGIIGFPIVVDPMVMYYNRDILSNEGIATVPTSWDQLRGVSQVLTKKRDDGTILQSTIALGQFDNITNAKDILATLLLQNGNPIMTHSDTAYTPVLNGQGSSSPISTAEHVVDFYVDFSNPSSQSYSWNRALPQSIDMFTGGKSALYLGHASELFKIQSVNPNLSFDVARVPQTKGMPAKRTFGKIYALAVNKKSPNVNTAFGVAGILSSGDTAKNFAQALSLPPALRSLLSNKPADPYLFTFFTEALTTRTWLDPDNTLSNAIFSELVGNVLSSRLSTSDAINKAQNQLELISKK